MIFLGLLILYKCENLKKNFNLSLLTTGIIYRIYYHLYRSIVVLFNPCGLGDKNSANICPCACRKRRLTKGYKLSYTTGLLHAWPSCM